MTAMAEPDAEHGNGGNGGNGRRAASGGSGGQPAPNADHPLLQGSSSLRTDLRFILQCVNNGWEVDEDMMRVLPQLCAMIASDQLVDGDDQRRPCNTRERLAAVKILVEMAQSRVMATRHASDIIDGQRLNVNIAHGEEVNALLSDESSADLLEQLAARQAELAGHLPPDSGNGGNGQK